MSTLIKTDIVREIPSANDPYQCDAFLVRGADVHRELSGNSSWIEMLWRLMRPSSPAPHQIEMLETLSVALMNPGPRDPSVYAAMCGGTSRSTAAACLIAALSAGAGRYQGAREVFDCMVLWAQCGQDRSAWLAKLGPRDADGVWPACASPAGWDPRHPDTGAPLQALLAKLIACSSAEPTRPLAWLADNMLSISQVLRAGCTLTMLAATAFTELSFSPEEGEMLFMLLRLPGAAAHSIEQSHLRFSEFPFPALTLIPPNSEPAC